MRKSNFSEGQMIGLLKQAGAGIPAAEICRKGDFSDATFYKLRSKFGSLGESEVKRLRELEDENARLKHVAGYVSSLRTPSGDTGTVAIWRPRGQGWAGVRQPRDVRVRRRLHTVLSFWRGDLYGHQSRRQTNQRKQGQAVGSMPLCRSGRRLTPRLADRVLVNGPRAAAKLAGRTKWLDGTALHYAFFGGSSHWAVPKRQADAARQAFAKWEAVGIGLEFKEVTQLSEAEVRIGYHESDGVSQSAVGRDVLTIPLDEPTTIYGWDLTSAYGSGAALHELGHVLGMEHERQNPFAGIRWHEEAVYANLGGPPNNWSREVTFHNVLEKLDPQQLQGSSWDPDSIMQYQFDSGLIDQPDIDDQNGLVPPGKLSPKGKEWVKKWYPGGAVPATLKPNESVNISLNAGQQVDYLFKPTQSRKYTFATHGASDTLLGLFEEISGQPRHLGADDDSGENRNASITHKVVAGRIYHVRLRLYHPGQTGVTSMLVT